MDGYGSAGQLYWNRTIHVCQRKWLFAEDQIVMMAQCSTRFMVWKSISGICDRNMRRMAQILMF